MFVRVLSKIENNLQCKKEVLLCALISTLLINLQTKLSQSNILTTKYNETNKYASNCGMELD